MPVSAILPGRGRCMSKLRHTADFVVDRQRLMSATEERGHARYASNLTECWIGWWKGGHPRIISGKLRDISPNGAGIELRRVPPPGVSVWFCPKRVKTPQWIEGSVARFCQPGRVSALFGTPSIIGLAFRDPCSWDLLRSVMFELNNVPGSVVAGYPPLPRPRGSGS